MTLGELIQQVKEETHGQLSQKEITYISRDILEEIKGWCRNLQSEANTSRKESGFTLLDEGSLLLGGSASIWDDIHKLFYKTSDELYQQLYIVDTREELLTVGIPAVYIWFRDDGAGSQDLTLTPNFSPINEDDDKIVIHEYSDLTTSSVIDTILTNYFKRLFVSYCKMHMIEDPKVQIYIQLYNNFKNLFINAIQDSSFIDTGLLNTNLQID